MIGGSPRRKEDQRLLAGAGRYVDDITRERLVHLGVVRSAHAHARITAIRLDDARLMPGVVGAWAAADLPEVARPIPRPQKGRPYVFPVLAHGIARYVGEPLAVVVADGPYAVADALQAVSVQYEPLPPLVTTAAALASGAALHDDWADNVALSVGNGVGDVDAALAGAHLVIREQLRHPRLASNPIEPRGVLAYPDPDSGALVVATSTQNPYQLRDAVASVLGLPAEQVRILVPDVGGGFGPKEPAYPEDILVAAVALKLKRPVKWIESRREHLMSTGHDREQEHDVTMGFAADGRIVGLTDSFVADVGAYPACGSAMVLNTINHLPGPYRVPAFRGAARSVVTTKAFNAAYRGSGRPEAAFVTERMLDLGARRLGIDAAEIRRRNLVRPEEMPYRPGFDYKDGVPIVYDPSDPPAAFERALAMLGYDDWRTRQAARGDAGPRIGIGLACFMQGTGIGPFEGATVRVDPSGKVYVFIGVTQQGQGHATTLAQIAAAELGATLDDVTVVAGDTNLFPYGMGTGGSRVAANAGPAVAKTARLVRERATRVAADLLECAPEDVRIADGRVHVAGVSGRFITLGRVAAAALQSRTLLALGEPGLNACTYFSPETVTWAFGAHAAVVEVDLPACAIRLVSYVMVHDAGRAINPMIVDGQLAGGAVQGIGAGLMEEVVYDAGGQLLTGTLTDYAVPRADQLPSLSVALEDHPSAMNALGIKGVGESSTIPGAAVIANAVEDAVSDLGVTIREVPITPSRLFTLIAGACAGGTGAAAPGGRSGGRGAGGADENGRSVNGAFMRPMLSEEGDDSQHYLSF
jgi:aerobic carbon-monoxide dehydrogenase large subunit